MPELPEVEVVRRGLAAHVAGGRITAAEVLSARTARRFEPGTAALAHELVGREVASVDRRGKYLWLALSDAPGTPATSALAVHLGMSGQMLVRTGAPVAGRHPHLRASLAVDTPAGAVRVEFVDQRTFGWWMPAPLLDADGTVVPAPVAHIARDPLDPLFDHTAVVADMRRRRSGIKRLLLDQTVVSGVGNIYADEALWRAGIHGERPAEALSRPALRRLLGHVREVLAESLAQGGTSFDALYVNVNGESGYFSRSLNVYGREGEPCARCGAPIRRERFMNRSSYSCPRCQVRPRGAAHP